MGHVSHVTREKPASDRCIDSTSVQKLFFSVVPYATPFRGRAKCPCKMVSHPPFDFSCFVERSASRPEVGTQCSGGFKGTCGLGLSRLWYFFFHWCRASTIRPCLSPAKSMASLFSLGARGTPSRWMWSYKLRQSVMRCRRVCSPPLLSSTLSPSAIDKRRLLWTMLCFSDPLC